MVGYPFKLDTNNLMLEINRYDTSVYTRSIKSGSRKCTKMNYSTWLSRLLPLTDKIAKEQAVIKEWTN